MFLAAIPGLIVASGVKGMINQAAQSAEGEVSLMSRYTQLAADVLPEVVARAIQIYIVLILLGLGLMLLAFFLSLVIRERKPTEKVE